VVVYKLHMHVWRVVDTMHSACLPAAAPVANRPKYSFLLSISFGVPHAIQVDRGVWRMQQRLCCTTHIGMPNQHDDLQQ
jgi:hypothetical protein